MSWVSQNMTDDTRRTVNTFLGSRDAASEPKAARGLMRIFTLIFAGGLIYISLPYAGAFVDVGKVVSVSKLDRKVGQLTSEITKTSPVKKVYLRQGQGLKASYNIPKGTAVTLTVLQCKSQPVIEVFSCNPLSKEDIVIKKTTAGSRGFRAPQAGFYYFRDSMTFPTSGQLPYTLHWTRT